MCGWIRSCLLTGACALTWACGGGGGPIFPNPNTNVVSATSPTAIVGRDTTIASTSQVSSSAPLGRSDVGVIDSESTTDNDDNAVATLAAATDPAGLSTPLASELGWISAPQPEGSAPVDQNAITIINIGGDKHIHLLGDGHGHPLIIIVAGTDTVTFADVVVRQKPPISLRAESEASNHVMGSLSS
jgi:hypothetical protein